MYCFVGDKLHRNPEVLDFLALSDPLLLVAENGEVDEVLARLEIPAAFSQDFCDVRVTRFESGDSYDFFTIRQPAHRGKQALPSVSVLIRKRLLLFVSEDAAATYEQVRQCVQLDHPAILGCYFDRMIAGDLDRLESVEAQIAALEERITEKGHTDSSGEIVGLRRAILRYKNNYDRLFTVLEDLLANENGIFEREALKKFRSCRNRIDRLHQKTLNLQEQVAQLREAYQSQLDISLNRSMKVLTVVTVLFMPLTLVAGWYGMNFNMPEFRWSFGYPFVIILSILIVVVLLIYFKKNKWI